MLYECSTFHNSELHIKRLNEIKYKQYLPYKSWNYIWNSAGHSTNWYVQNWVWQLDLNIPGLMGSATEDGGTLCWLCTYLL